MQIYTILLGTVPKERTDHSKVAKEQRIYCVRRWNAFIHLKFNCSMSAICASDIRPNFNINRRCCTPFSEMDGS